MSDDRVVPRRLDLRRRTVLAVGEYAELSGHEGPQVETRQGFETIRESSRGSLTLEQLQAERDKTLDAMGAQFGDRNMTYERKR